MSRRKEVSHKNKKHTEHTTKRNSMNISSGRTAASSSIIDTRLMHTQQVQQQKSTIAKRRRDSFVHSSETIQNQSKPCKTIRNHCAYFLREQTFRAPVVPAGLSKHFERPLGPETVSSSNFAPARACDGDLIIHFCCLMLGNIFV